MCGWWNESERHSLARKGVKTAKPNRAKSKGLANEVVIQHKLSNNIHKNITALDRKLRKVANLDSEKHIMNNLEEAEKLYSQLGQKMQNHKERYGNMPDWIQHDWVNGETFNNDGKVYKQIQKMKKLEGKELKAEQKKMWNLIALSTENKR